MRRPGLAVCVTLAVLAALLIAPVIAAPKLRWSDRTPMPTPRHEFAYAKLGSSFYVMAGFAAGVNTVPLVDVYDIGEDAWTQAPALPYAPNHAMGAAKNGVVYNLGGYLAVTSVPTDRAVALVDGAWADMPPMPEARAAGAAEFLGGKLYAVGGVGPDGVVDDTFVFDTASQDWSTMPGPPTKLEHLALVRHEGRLYAIAGRALTLESINASVQRFDPQTGAWTQLPPLPRATSGHVAVATRNDYLVVLGGEGPEGVHADAFALDLRRPRRWRTLPELAPARTGFGIAAAGSKVFVFGGAGDDPAYYDLTQRIDLRSLRRQPRSIGRRS